MLLLTTSSDLVKVNTSASTDIEVHASWADNVSGVVTAGRTNTASITGTGDTTVVAGPSSGQRAIRHLNIRNNHASTACDIKVSHSDGTEVTSLMFATLLAGESLVLDHSGRWSHFTVNGYEYSKVGMIHATAAEMESGSSVERSVDPSKLHRHPSMGKFWACMTVAGLLDALPGGAQPGYNVSSVTDTGAGLVTANASVAFSGTSWCCLAGSRRSSATLTVTNLKFVNIRSATQAAGSVTLECYDGTATNAVQEDPSNWHLAGFGDQ